MSSFDMTVIGAGPGGYVAAIRGAQLGMKVAIIEKEPKLGGTCLRVGCIPSKALLESSEFYYQATRHFDEHGISTTGTSVNVPTMIKRKSSIVEELTSGVKFLMQKNKIKIFAGFGKITGPNDIRIEGNDGNTESITSKAIVIATGSDAIQLPFAPFDGKFIVSSTEALEFEKVPEHLIVVGAGAVGLELGSVWSRLGAKVTVIELLNRITPFADKQASSTLQRSLKKQGLSFLLESKMKAARVDEKAGRVEVDIETGDKLETLKGDRLLIAVGRRPYTDGLGLEQIGVATERGKVIINDHFQTNIPSIYALGDVVRGPMLAHKAEEEGVAVAEILAGQPGHVNYSLIPNVVYTAPELAMVGIHEEEAKEKGLKYKVGKSLFRANGRAKTLGETDGFVKVISDAETDRVLGVTIVGPRASDMIAEAVIAMEFSASSEDIVRTSHAHPTLSETFREAAMAVDRRAIHG